MRTAIILTLAISLSACTTQRDIVVTTLKPVIDKKKPKEYDKEHPRRYTANVKYGNDAKASPAQVEVYDVGETINEKGDLVAAHKVFHLLVGPHWVVTSKVKDDKPTLEPAKSKDDLTAAVNEARKAAAEARAARDQLQQMSKGQPQDQGVDPSVKRQVEEGFSQSPETGAQALQDFTKTNGPGTP